jgi:hypothetical protein
VFIEEGGRFFVRNQNLRNFPRNFLGKQFFETFPAENSNFRNILGGKKFGDCSWNFPRKNHMKNWPLVIFFALFGTNVSRNISAASQTGHAGRGMIYVHSF